MGRAPHEIFRTLTTSGNLQQIYFHHIKTGAARGRDGIDPLQLEPDIVTLTRRLSRNMRNGSHEFTQFRQLLIPKGAGKNPRVISVPSARDRIVLKALTTLLSEIFPDSRGVIPQIPIGSVQAAAATDEWDHFIKIDVRDFYPSIPHDRIMLELSRRVRKKEVLSLLLKAISTPTVPDGGRHHSGRNIRGVPQGLSISNPLAEIVMGPLDKAFVLREECRYFRFVDDILILCSHNRSAELEKEVIDRVAALGLETYEINAEASKKSYTGSMSAGFDYLGYVFEGPRITVRSSSVLRVESALAREFTRYQKGTAKLSAAQMSVHRERSRWFINLVISGCVFNGAARGWLPYYRQMNDLTLLSRLDATVRRLERRFALDRSEAKTFVKTYWALKHPHAHRGYIPNFDSYSEQQMRDTLSTFNVPDAHTMPSSLVKAAFLRAINKKVSSLEHDIGIIS